MSKWTGLFLPIFSRFVEIWKKKIEKLKKLSFGCHFGRKRREKAGKTSVKFENLEEKMSKWTGLNKQTKKFVKIWKKKNYPKWSFVWREGGRKEEKSLTNKQTRKILKSKEENSLTNKQKNCTKFMYILQWKFQCQNKMRNKREEKCWE